MIFLQIIYMSNVTNMKEKKNNSLFIICSILALIIAALIGFVIGDKMAPKENKETKYEQQEPTEVSETEEVSNSETVVEENPVQEETKTEE